MSTNTTTTTTTTPTGETTIQKVVSEGEDWLSSTETNVHVKIGNWLAHLRSLATIGTYTSAAYALWTFARHLV
jgi:hypothetical protein